MPASRTSAVEPSTCSRRTHSRARGKSAPKCHAARCQVHTWMIPKASTRPPSTSRGSSLRTPARLSLRQPLVSRFGTMGITVRRNCSGVQLNVPLRPHRHTRSNRQHCTSLNGTHSLQAARPDALAGHRWRTLRLLADAARSMRHSAADTPADVLHIWKETARAVTVNRYPKALAHGGSL